MGWPPAVVEVLSFPRWYYASLTLAEWDELMGAFFDRTKKVADASANAGPLKDTTFVRDYPLLAECMTTRAVVDGKETNRCSLSVFVHDGMWKAILRDKADQLCLWVASGTHGKLLDVLEAALEDPETEWRTDRYQGAPSAKRTKKGS